MAEYKLDPLPKISPNFSDTLLPSPSIAAQSSGPNCVRPIIRPAIIKPPIAIITVEGEWIPSMLFIESMIALPMSFIVFHNLEAPSPNPF